MHRIERKSAGDWKLMNAACDSPRKARRARVLIVAREETSNATVLRAY